MEEIRKKSQAGRKNLIFEAERKFRKLEERAGEKEAILPGTPVYLQHKAAKKEGCRARFGKEWMRGLSPGYGCARGSAGICPSRQEAKK